LKVRVRRIRLASLARFGCLLGAVAAFLPSLLCGLLSLGLAGWLRRWLEGWRPMTISLLGTEFALFDPIQLLGLESLLARLQALTSAWWLVLILGVLALALLSGALLAAIVALVGLVYNLIAAASGGLVVELSAVEDNRRPE
jgi:hypothetical protein